MALLAAVLATTSPAGSQEPVYAPIGTLDLFASTTTGDGFDFTPTNESAATATESFSSNNQSKLSENGPDDLVVLTETGPGGGQLPYVGLKDHEIGVRSKGEGSGTPASRVDADETLTIELGPDVLALGDGARSAQIALSAKFGAIGSIQALNGLDNVGSPIDFSCTGNDCGPDSNGDRLLVTIPDMQLFTGITISLTEGAVSLIDDPNDDFDTYFEIVKEFDGVLACDDVASLTSEGFSSSFKRLGAGVDEDCGILKPFNEDIRVDGVIEFEPESEISSVYRGDLTFPAGAGSEFFAALEYDADGPVGGESYTDMLPCVSTPVSDAREVAIASYFVEMGAGFFPEMPGTETSCVVALSTIAGGEENWVVRLDFDPWFR